MEKSDSVESHHHVVPVGTFDYIVVTDTSARLGDHLYTAAVSTLDVVAKREESIRTEGNISILLIDAFSL